MRAGLQEYKEQKIIDSIMFNATGLSPFRGKINRFIIPLAHYQGLYKTPKQADPVVVADSEPEYKSYAKVPTFHRIVDALLLKMPILGTLIQNHELGRFSYILSLMLSSGVAYAQAVQLAKSTFSNHALSDLFDKASTKVLEGNKLSNSLQMVKGVKLKRNFMQSLALGEESSEVAEILENVSTLYAEENEDRLKLLLGLLEPFMMLFIGLIVGIIVSAMLLPIFTMTQGLQ